MPKGTSFFYLKIEKLCRFIQFAQKSQMNFVRKYGKYKETFLLNYVIIYV